MDEEDKPIKEIDIQKLEMAMTRFEQKLSSNKSKISQQKKSIAYQMKTVQQSNNPSRLEVRIESHNPLVQLSQMELKVGKDDLVLKKDNWEEVIPFDKVVIPESAQAYFLKDSKTLFISIQLLNQIERLPKAKANQKNTLPDQSKSQIPINQETNNNSQTSSTKTLDTHITKTSNPQSTKNKTVATDFVGTYSTQTDTHIKTSDLQKNETLDTLNPKSTQTTTEKPTTTDKNSKIIQNPSSFKPESENILNNTSTIQPSSNSPSTPSGKTAPASSQAETPLTDPKSEPDKSLSTSKQSHSNSTPFPPPTLNPSQLLRTAPYQVRQELDKIIFVIPLRKIDPQTLQIAVSEKLFIFRCVDESDLTFHLSFVFPHPVESHFQSDLNEENLILRLFKKNPQFWELF